MSEYTIRLTNHQNITSIFLAQKTKINLNLQEKKISFKAGNNSFGNFELEGNILKFKFLAGTKMMCIKEEDRAIEQFMNDFWSFKNVTMINGEDGEVLFFNGSDTIVCKKVVENLGLGLFE